MLFLKAVLTFLVFDSLSSGPTRATRRISTIGMRGSVPRASVNSLVCRRPTTRGIMVRNKFNCIGGRLLIALGDTSDLPTLGRCLTNINNRIINRVPIATSCRVLLPTTRARRRLRRVVRRLGTLPCIEHSSLGCTFRLRGSTVSNSSTCCPGSGG